MDDEQRLKRARAKALAAMARRDVTEQEVRETMRRWGAPPEDADALVRSARAAGLVDEARLARGWVEARRDHRGRAGLERELRARGVDAAAVDEALATVDREAERSAAVGLLDKAAGRLAGLPAEVARRRAFGLLQRRGFGSEAMREAVKEVIGRGGEEGDD